MTSRLAMYLENPAAATETPNSTRQRWRHEALPAGDTLACVAAGTLLASKIPSGHGVTLVTCAHGASLLPEGAPSVFDLLREAVVGRQDAEHTAGGSSLSGV